MALSDPVTKLPASEVSINAGPRPHPDGGTLEERHLTDYLGIADLADKLPCRTGRGRGGWLGCRTGRARRL